MNSRFLVFVLLCLFVSCATQARAGDFAKFTPYVAVKAGASFIDAGDLRLVNDGFGLETTLSGTGDNGTVALVGIAAGVNYQHTENIPIRYELDYTYHSRFTQSATTGGTTYEAKIHAHTLFLNAALDIETGTPFVPYIGGGIGLTVHALDTTTTNGSSVLNIDDSSLKFSWNVGAGLGYRFTECVIGTLGYRYAAFGKPEVTDAFGTDLEFDLNAHEAFAGLRYEFR